MLPEIISNHIRQCCVDAGYVLMSKYSTVTILCYEDVLFVSTTRDDGYLVLHNGYTVFEKIAISNPDLIDTLMPKIATIIADYYNVN